MASWLGLGGGGSAAARSKTPPVADGKPLPLVSFDEATGSWRAGDEALAVVARCRHPIAVLAVCGRARQGKSFVLNQVLQRLTGQPTKTGFVVSPTHQSCTRGLWLWSVPIPIQAGDGNNPNQRASLLLVDCEGVDAYDQGAQAAAQVFSLAVLLSSVFVFNQLGAVDAVAIERLALACELAKRVKDRSGGAAGGGGGGGGNGADLSSSSSQADFHPAFVWLLRDFQLELREGRTRLTPAEYLEEALSDAAMPASSGGGHSTAADAAARNAPRQTIRAVFPDRDAFTLVRPALTEEQLNKLDTLPASSLRPEFRQGMDELARALKAKAVRRPLAVHGQLVSGPALAGLVRAYVDAINGGAVPQLVSAWAGVARQECGKAVDLGKRAYGEAWQEPALDGSAAADDAALQAAHTAALQQALRAFREAAMGDADLRLEHEEGLRASLDALLEDKRRAAAASSERVAREMLEQQTAKLGQMLSLGPAADLDAVETELRRFLDAYDRAVPATWPPKYKRAAEFLMNCILGLKGLLRAASAARDDAVLRLSAAEASASDLRSQVAGSAERAASSERACQDLRQRLAAAEADLQARGEALAVAEAELASARSAGGREAARLCDEAAALRQEAARAGAAAQESAQARARHEAEAAQLRAEAQTARQQLSEAREAAERASAAAEQRASAAERELAAARARLSELEAAAQGELQGERGRVAEASAKLARAQRDLAAERAAAGAARMALSDARAELAALRAAGGGGGGGGGAGGGSAAAATPASGRGGAAAGRPASASAGKRTRRGSGAAGAGAGTAAAAADDEDFMDAEEAPPAPAAAAAAAAAGPSPSRRAALIIAEPLPSDPSKMTVAALKQWVTGNRIEDAEFLQLCGGKAKKSDWVDYVTRRNAELGG
jgi:hypothetical protein